MNKFDELTNAFADLDAELMEDLINQIIAEDPGNAQQALAAGQKGMVIVGERFDDGVYFVGDLVYAGQLMTEAADLLKDHLSADGPAGVGKVVICTVKDDLHDIGKNIVGTMMEASGMEIIDLGIDVPASAVVKAVQDTDPDIVAMSGVLTLALNSMKDVVDALVEAGLRDKVKVIIGGSPVTADGCKYVQADAWSNNAADGVGVCLNWLAKS